MGYRYAVLGAGMQGIAIAHDLAKHGEAEEIVVFDSEQNRAEAACLVIEMAEGNTALARSQVVDFTHLPLLPGLLGGFDVIISAAHHTLGPLLASVAITARAHYVDLGGNTEMTRAIKRFSHAANVARIALVPDSGMAPGLNLSLAEYAMSYFDIPLSVTCYSGGLTLAPEGPLHHTLLFSIDGLVNEYSGRAEILRNGALMSVEALSEVEELSVEIGPGTTMALEAAHTSGGLGLAPVHLSTGWGHDTLRTLEYKTLRHRGHWEAVRQVRDMVGIDWIRSRYPSEPENVPDIGIVMARCRGRSEKGSEGEVVITVVDTYDQATGLTAMQRLTGFHAGAVAHLLASGRLVPAGRVGVGFIPVEQISGALMVHELARRGIPAPRIERNGATGRTFKKATPI